MAGPGDETAGGAPGHLRASHADRAQAIEVLKAAFVQGRLTKDEFDARVSQGFASRTYAELSALTADIPAGQTPAKPPAPAQAQAEQPVARPGPVIAASTAAYAGLWVSVVFLANHSAQAPWAPPLIFGGFAVYVLILAISLAHMVASRRERRSGGQAPRPASGAGGQAPQRLPSGSAGRQLPPGDEGRWYTADAAPVGRPRLQTS